MRLQAQAAAGPEPTWLIAEDEAEEAQLVAGRIAELIRSGTPASEIAVLDAGQCAVGGLRAGAHPGEGALHRQGRRAFLRAARGARGDGAAARGGAGRRGGHRRRIWWLPSARCWLGTAGVPTSRRRASGRSASAGKTSPRWCGLRRRRRLTPRQPRRRRRPAEPGGLRRRSRRACRGAARPDRRGRHPRVAACGQGPGVGRRLPGRPGRGMLPISYATTEAAVAGGAPAALRRRHPGSAPAHPVLGQGPGSRPPAPQALALPGRARPGAGGAARCQAIAEQARRSGPPAEVDPRCGRRCGVALATERPSRSSRRSASSPMPPWRRSRASVRRPCSSCTPFRGWEPPSSRSSGRLSLMS